MPARPPVPGAIKVEVTWTCNSIPLANVLHVGYSTSPPVAADLQALAAAIYTCFATYWCVNIVASYVLLEVICTDLSSDSGQVGSYSLATAGSKESDPISAGSAFLVNWQIGRRYRGGKPRTYLPPESAADLLTPSTWKDVSVTDAVNLAAALMSVTAAHTFGGLTTTGLGCVSYVADDLRRIAPVFELFVGHSVGNLVRSQRRRITASSF